MAKKGIGFLDTDDKFPELSLRLTNGHSFIFPDHTNDDYAVLLIYRGDW